jgi:membrane protease subunit HflK
LIGHPREIGGVSGNATVFPETASYNGPMKKRSGWLASIGAVLSENGGPWGNRGGGGDDGSSGGGRPNPWSRPPGGDRPRGGGGGPGPSAVDQILAKLRELFGGSGGGFPRPGGVTIWPYVAVAFVALWLALTSMHRIGPEQAGVITTLGKYSRTLGPGVGFSLPAPFERVQKIDIQAIRTIPIGQPGGDDNLVLTGDQNLVDLAYAVRWSVKPGAAEQYLFQLADPEQTISEVAESAMRAVLANFTLIDAIGPGRNDVEQRVRETMQVILDDYKAGVQIQGVSISQADPPSAVNEAFKEVTAAQQRVQSNLNEARTYAQQVVARAQGDAEAFNKVYEQYKLAPEVTRRRMYYETMERVLSKVDKTIVEAPGVTPYLPLPQLQRRPAEGAAR